MLATAFGLDVHGEQPTPLLGSPRATPTGREVRLRVGEGLSWSGGETICEERKPDGSPNFRIEAHPQAGYLIGGPDYGMHVVSRDGGEIRCSPQGEWERMLIAQLLPFAALLHGLEVFHSSAVVIDGRAVGLMAPSGAGKTSVALALCRRGADFLADDVLAVEACHEQLLGHPGTPMAGVARLEAERLRLAHGEDGRDAVLGASERELLVSVPGAQAPAPVEALFFLDRRVDGPGAPRFEPLGDPQALLAATFNFVLATPKRLQGLLDACALLARGRVERVLVGPTTDAGGVAEAIERRLSAAA